jgi:4-hydroxy-3-methylbut-2-enyl diphosphate reductase
VPAVSRIAARRRIAQQLQFQPVREIGDEMGRPAYLVADGSAIDPPGSTVSTIGLTAGASAPEELVQSVIAAIAKLRPITVQTFDGIEEKLQFRLPPELNRLPQRNQAA